MFKGAGKQLPLQINSKKPGAGVDVFVACHAVSALKINGGVLMQTGGWRKMPE